MTEAEKKLHIKCCKLIKIKLFAKSEGFTGILKRRLCRIRQGRGLIFSRIDQTFEVKKWFYCMGSSASGQVESNPAL